MKLDKKILAVIVAALGLAIVGPGCDPGSDSVEEAQRADTTSGAEAAKPDDDENDGMTESVGEDGFVDDDTFGEEGIIDDSTFGEEGLIDDDF